MSEEAIEWKYPLLGGLLTTMTQSTTTGYLVMRLQSTDKSSSNDNGPPILVTGLMDYTPTLVGKKTWYNPLWPLRVAVYLGTQSVIHGHVMWRFHNHVRQSTC
jgi:hypothetical protein